jgi:hypothetical protein
MTVGVRRQCNCIADLDRFSSNGVAHDEIRIVATRYVVEVFLKNHTSLR